MMKLEKGKYKKKWKAKRTSPVKNFISKAESNISALRMIMSCKGPSKKMYNKSSISIKNHPTPAPVKKKTLLSITKELQSYQAASTKSKSFQKKDP